MKAWSAVRTVSWSVLTVAAVGCYPPLPEPPPPEPEHRWCVYADPATGLRVADEGYQPITDPDTGLWMSGCTCLCPEDHAVMVAGVNGMLVPGSDAETFYESQVAILRTAAEVACLQRVNELQMTLGTALSFDFPGTVSCQEAVADEEPQYTGECGPGQAECQGGGTAGLDTGSVASSTDAATADGTGTSLDDDATSADATTNTDATSDGSGTTSGGVVIDRLRSG